MMSVWAVSALLAAPASGAAPVIAPVSLPGPFYGASTFADTSDWAFWFITWLSVFFFVIIVGLMFWFMWKYRRIGHGADTAGPTHHTVLEVTWTVIPMILVVAIFWVGMKEYLVMRIAPQNSYEVHVKAQKWNWTLTYPNGGMAVTGPYGAGDPLIFPAGQPVKLVMESADVLHAFFVPAFRTKQDIVPGRVTTLWFEATTPGMYDLFCAEYCGRGHSEMLGKVEVLDPEAFQVRVDELADWIKKVPEENLWWAAGPKLYNRCASCHTVDGKDSTGPTFAGLWTKLAAGDETFTDGSTLKQRIDDGTYKSPEDYVLQSIWFPQQHIVKGRAASMPTFKGQLDEKGRSAMLMYLKELSKDPSRFNKDGSIKDEVLKGLKDAAKPADPAKTAAVN